MTTLEVIVYGNGDLFREYFNAIVTAFGKGNSGGSFKTLLHIAILLSGFTVIYSFILKKDLMVMVKWLGLFYVAIYILFLPEATLVITDRVNNDTHYTVDHVPLGLAILASYTSTIGDALTQNIESQFTMPDDIRYHHAGMVFASRLVEAASQFEVTDAQFDQNLREFIHQCVFYDLLLGKYSINTLMSSGNVWNQVAENASPARAFIYNSEVTTCREGAKKLTQYWKQEKISAAEKYGKRIYPHMANDKAKKALQECLKTSYQYLARLSADGADILQQNIMANAIQRGIVSMGAKLNAPAALEAYAFARAQEQKRLTNKTLGDMAAHWLPLMKNAFEAIMYASFIFIVLLSVFPFGWIVVKNYIYTLMWIQIWAPLYAVINLIVSYYAEMHSMAAADGVLSMQSLSGVLQINSDISGLAGYLTLSVPFLSAGLVRGMASTFTHISQSINGVTQSTGSTAAAEAVSGNISLGNTSLNNQTMLNTSANHFDTSGRVNTGSFTTTMAGGSVATVTADGSVVMDMKNSISSLGASVNVAETLRASYSHQAERATSAALSNAVSASQATSSIIKNSHDLSQHLGNTSTHVDGWSVSASAGVTQAVSNLDRATQEFSHRHGISHNEAAHVLANAHIAGQVTAGFHSKGVPAGKILSALGVDASISGTAGLSRTASHNHATDHSSLFSDAESYVKEHHFSKNIDTVERAVKDQSFKTNNEQGRRLVESMGASFDQARSFRNDINNHLSQVESARTHASIAQDKAETINANASQGLMEYISSQPGTNGQGKLGLHQAETIMKDPAMQLYYTRKYAEQFRPEIESNWNHGLASNKSAIESHFQDKNHPIKNTDSLQENYDADKNAILSNAQQNGLSSGQGVDQRVKHDVEKMVINNNNQLGRGHQDILSSGIREQEKGVAEKARKRHGALGEDMVHGIDTKDSL